MKLNVVHNELPEPLNTKILAAKKGLPEMKIKETNLGDPLNFDKGVQKWQNVNKNGWFANLTGAFFQLSIIKVVSAFSWIQPLIKAKTEEFEDQDGNKIAVSGLVINLIDELDRTIFRMNNEPGAQAEIIDGKEIHPKLQPTMQTSVAKMVAVQAGEVEKDKGLAILLEIFQEKGRSFDYFDWQIADCCHDTNRIEGLVAYTKQIVDPDELEYIAKKIGGIILDSDEIQDIQYCQPGLLNPHSLFPIATP